MVSCHAARVGSWGLVCVCVCVLPGLVNRRNMTASVWWNGTLHFTSCMSSHFIAVSFCIEASLALSRCAGLCVPTVQATHTQHTLHACVRHLSVSPLGHRRRWTLALQLLANYHVLDCIHTQSNIFTCRPPLFTAYTLTYVHTYASTLGLDTLYD